MSLSLLTEDDAVEARDSGVALSLSASLVAPLLHENNGLGVPLPDGVRRAFCLSLSADKSALILLAASFSGLSLLKIDICSLSLSADNPALSLLKFDICVTCLTINH